MEDRDDNQGGKVTKMQPSTDFWIWQLLVAQAAWSWEVLLPQQRLLIWQLPNRAEAAGLLEAGSAARRSGCSWKPDLEL